MTHIASIGAGIYSDLSVGTDATTLATAIAAGNAATKTELEACFAASKYERILNVREFPSMGTPPNIVNVPVYGSKTSAQIQGQSDSPTIEITINYVATDWAAGATLGDMVGDGTQRVFRFTLLNAKPDGYDATAAGMGSAENTSYYWIGKVEALLVNPQLTDSNTATLTISVQSEFLGAYTQAPA